MFSDIHTHLLYGVDDGAKTEKDMFSMIDTAYSEGTRQICFTPHYHPGYYGNNKEKSETVFETVKEYCHAKYPDMVLALGNELHYNQNCVSWIRDGLCRCMNDTRYILVDFHEKSSAKEIMMGLEKILSSGYLPILAHAERYSALNIARIREIKQNGVLIQVNSGSLFRDFGLLADWKAKKILALRLVDFISSDAHNLKSRPPYVKHCYDYVAKSYGREYADLICMENAKKLIFNNA